MDEILNTAEIHKRYLAEWILVGDPQSGPTLEVQAGRVLFHSPDRDAVYRKAIELRPKRFAILYTGTMPEGTAILI